MLRVIHDIAQAEHEAGAGRLHDAQRILDFASQPQRLLVDNENVRREHFGSVTNDGSAQLQDFGDVHVQTER